MSKEAEHTKEETISKLSWLTPVQIYGNLTEEIFNLVEGETLCYTLEKKNDSLFSLEDHELKRFTCFLIFSGYVKLPSKRLYWLESEDSAQEIVRNALPRNIYMKIK